jgi:Domain of unknown function (DUF4157)
MALRSHAHQKASSDTASTTVQHASRPFAPQTKPEAEQTQTLPELQTQLETAQRFGHHLADFSLSAHSSAPPLIQPKLVIGAPGDKYEQEADRVAQQVVQRLHAPQMERLRSEAAVQRETQPEENELQTKPLSDRIQRVEMPENSELQMRPMLLRMKAMGSREASPNLESAISRAKGGGQSLDAGLQKSMGQAMGANFSGVRVHTDAQADQLNRSIQAKAFTTGQNVFFRQGAYNPGSRSGQELLAHELTHVVQQGAASRPTTAQRSEDKSASDITRPYISTSQADNMQLIQRVIETNGGRWTTDTYRAIEDGAEIILDFAPNATVNAEKIGLIQKVLRVEQGRNYDVDARRDLEQGNFQPPAQKRRAQRSDGRSHIDRAHNANNPIYGAPDLNEGETLSDTPKGTPKELNVSQAALTTGTAKIYQLGARHKDWTRMKTKERSAKLYDRPEMPGATGALQENPNPDNRSQMTFETTALCVSGKQKGRYYGSVEWGFDITESGSVVRPITKLSDGNPTEEMAGVMRNWNQGQDHNNRDNPQIPIPGEE